MAMTEKEQRRLRSFCAFLLDEYGIQMSPNDPAIPAIYPIYRITERVVESNKEIASQIERALEKINPKVYNFYYPGAARELKWAITFRWGLIGTLVAIILWIVNWRWSMDNDVEGARVIIESSGNMGELHKRVEKDKDGFYFIDFTAAKGDFVQSFTEFDKLNAKTVRVYLGKQPK